MLAGCYVSHVWHVAKCVTCGQTWGGFWFLESSQLWFLGPLNTHFHLMGLWTMTKWQSVGFTKLNFQWKLLEKYFDYTTSIRIFNLTVIIKEVLQGIFFLSYWSLDNKKHKWEHWAILLTTVCKVKLVIWNGICGY